MLTLMADTRIILNLNSKVGFKCIYWIEDEQMGYNICNKKTEV